MRRFGKILFRGAAVACGAALIWAGFIAYFEYQFEAEVDSLRAAGARVDLEQFNVPPVPDDENAALLFREARDWRNENDLDAYIPAWELDEWETDSRFHESPGWTEGWEEVTQWIEKQAPFFERVERGLKMPRCNFGVDHREAWDAVVESIPLSRVIADAYEWRVRVAEHRSQPAMDSLDDCRTVLRWARRIDRGFVIGYGVVGTVDSVGCEMVQRVAGMQGFDATKAWSALQPLLVVAEDERVMWAAFEGERAVLIRVVRALTSCRGMRELRRLIFGETEYSAGVQIAMTAVRPLLWRNGTHALQLWERAGEIIQRAGADALPELESLADEWEWDEAADGVPPIWRFNTMLYHRLPATLYKMRLRHLAHLRVTRLGLICLEHRKRTGRWPEEAPAIVDPFTGKPFELTVEADTLRIEAAVSWLDEYEGEFREEQRIHWRLPVPEQR